ncbi:hypothetical protein K438DRAFT_1855641, partial [Mycena galopus ATCC 62051]
MHVAVDGTNGWFLDGPEKPWLAGWRVHPPAPPSPAPDESLTIYTDPNCTATNENENASTIQDRLSITLIPFYTILPATLLAPRSPP